MGEKVTLINPQSYAWSCAGVWLEVGDNEVEVSSLSAAQRTAIGNAIESGKLNALGYDREEDDDEEPAVRVSVDTPMAALQRLARNRGVKFRGMRKSALVEALGGEDRGADEEDDDDE